MSNVIQFPTPQNPLGDTSATGTHQPSKDDSARRTRQPRKDGTRSAVGDGTQKRHYKPRARHCKVCGDEFTPDAKHGRYCSPACRKKAYRQRIAKGRKTASPPAANLDLITCEHCGGTNLITAGKGAKFCSPTCRQRSYKARRLATIEALMRDTNISQQTAHDALDRAGLKSMTAYLTKRGYVYHDPARQWIRLLAAAGD